MKGSLRGERPQTLQESIDPLTKCPSTSEIIIVMIPVAEGFYPSYSPQLIGNHQKLNSSKERKHG
jgi:hypothetical protein